MRRERNLGQRIVGDPDGAITEVRVFQREKANFGNVVQTWEGAKMAEREGFERLLPLEAKSPDQRGLS